MKIIHINNEQFVSFDNFLCSSSNFGDKYNFRYHYGGTCFKSNIDFFANLFGDNAFIIYTEDKVLLGGYSYYIIYFSYEKFIELYNRLYKIKVFL
jgi:hypothetical protein